GRQIGQRGGRRAPPDFAEREPVGAEMHAFEREVDAEREGARPDADERAIVAQPACGGSEARENGAQAIELAACPQAERLPLPLRAHAFSGGSIPASTGCPCGSGCAPACTRYWSLYD